MSALPQDRLARGVLDMPVSTHVQDPSSKNVAMLITSSLINDQGLSLEAEMIEGLPLDYSLNSKITYSTHFVFQQAKYFKSD